MAAAGIDPLIVMTRSPAQYFWPAEAADNSAEAWQARWLGWQQWYAHAFVHARFNDVAGFQFFNEPDNYSSDSASLSQEQLVEMIRYGADAAQAAIADVNRRYGKSLEAKVYAPVTTSPKLDPGNWGHTVVSNHLNTLSPASSPDGQLFQRFAYHNYGSPPERFGDRVAETTAAIDDITGGRAAAYPIAITEFNTRTSSDYAVDDPVANPDGVTPDSPEMASRLGQILVNLANNQPEELYLFKFSDAGGANNGVHWQSGTDTRNIGGVSALAWSTSSSWKGSPPATCSSRRRRRRRVDGGVAGGRHPLSLRGQRRSGRRLGPHARPLRVGTAPGTRVTVRQVSSGHQGDVSQSSPSVTIAR